MIFIIISIATESTEEHGKIKALPGIVPYSSVDSVATLFSFAG
jgi:hypothetical protein